MFNKYERSRFGKLIAPNELKETLYSGVTPTISISEELANDSNLDFFINTDPNLIGLFLSKFGLSDDQIANLRISIEGHGDHFGHYGSYNKEKNSISIFTKNVWLNYHAILTLAALGDVDNSHLSDTLYTKRLPDYLKQNPTQEGFEFAEKLVRNGINRRFRRTLIHENGHAIDEKAHNRKIFRLFEKSATIFPAIIIPLLGCKIGSDLGNQLEISTLVYGPLTVIVGSYTSKKVVDYLLDYSNRVDEISARSFAFQHMLKPEWKQMITFEPKPEYIQEMVRWIKVREDLKKLETSLLSNQSAR